MSDKFVGPLGSDSCEVYCNHFVFLIHHPKTDEFAPTASVSDLSRGGHAGSVSQNLIAPHLGLSDARKHTFEL